MPPHSNQAIVGLDIGGANLKAAIWLNAHEARATSLNFPMWKQPERLGEGVRTLLKELGALGEQPRLAVTMTGELADCFATRREGVASIIDQLCQVVPPELLSIYTVNGQWFTPEQSKADTWSVAASNWHALAAWLIRWPPIAELTKSCILVDIGSTTVDVLPVVDGRLATDARTDRDRLQRSQLIYTGLRRTPVCAVLPSVALGENTLPLMAELFATVDDAYVVLDLVAEDTSDCDSADGRPRTKSCAAMRLARMIGEDAERLSLHHLHSLAEQIVQAQGSLIAQAIEVNLNCFIGSVNVPQLICCGHGLPLWSQMIRNLGGKHKLAYLKDYLTEEVSRCAPAAAVAWLLQSNNMEVKTESEK